MALFDQYRCRICGCTDDHACPGGCFWVNDEHDLCSACVRKVLEELYCPACNAKSGLRPPCESDGSCCYDLSDIPEFNGNNPVGGDIRKIITRHTLKCFPEYFKAIKDGRKTFELRKNDRYFHVGDHLIICEYDPTAQEGSRLTGDSVELEVSYILDLGMFPSEDRPLLDGYVIMGLVNTDDLDRGD